MGEWKKVIVSGSNAELNNITASAAISASGKLYGGLAPTEDQTYVIIYDTQSGEFKYKELNLINTTAAPPLFIADMGPYVDAGDSNNYDDTTGEGGVSFKLSYDTGSSGGGTQIPFTIITAPTTGGGTQVADSGWYGINNEVTEIIISNNEDLSNPGGGITIPNDVLYGLIPGPDRVPVSIRLQGFDNDAVPAYPAGFSFQNYQARAFNDGGIGELRIYVNSTSSATRTIDLTNYGSITGVSNDITVNLSATSSNYDTTGNEDITKHHRSSSFNSIIIGTASQHDGFNYAYALHTGSKNGEDFAYITNFVQWFYDLDGASNPMSTNNHGIVQLDDFDQTSTSSISGIKFYNSSAATGVKYRYGVSIKNQYNAVYTLSNNAILVEGISIDSTNNFELTQSQVDSISSPTFAGPTNNSSLGSPLSPLISEAGASGSNTVVTCSMDIVFQNNTFHNPPTFRDETFLNNLEFNNDIDFRIDFNSPSGFHKNQLVFSHPNLNNFLINTLTVNADENYFEDFKGEEFRLISTSYDGVTDPSSSQYRWDSEENVVTGSDGYRNNLTQYYTHLFYPNQIGVANNLGTFASTYGPDDQPNNYIDATGEREYIRYFKVPPQYQGVSALNIEFLGSGSIVTDTSTHFTTGSTSFKIFIRRTGGTAQSILNDDFIDQSEVSYGYTNMADEGEKSKIPLTDSVSNITYQNQSSPNNPEHLLPVSVVKIIENASGASFQAGEMIMVKIVTPQNWGGYINAIGIAYNSRNADESVILTEYNNY